MSVGKRRPGPEVPRRDTEGETGIGGERDTHRKETERQEKDRQRHALRVGLRDRESERQGERQRERLSQEVFCISALKEALS